MFKKFFSYILVIMLIISTAGGITVFAEGSLITAIEINQALSYTVANEDGSVSLMSSFVADKDTAVFVSLSQPLAVDTSGNTQSLKIMRNGEEVGKLNPSPDDGPVTLLKFIPKSRRDVGNWKEGIYEFIVSVNGETASRTVEFKKTKSLKVLAVPVIANYGGEVRYLDGKWKTGNSFLSKVFPVSNKGIEWELAPDFDASDPMYDLKTEDGMTNLWNALCGLQVRDENGNPVYELIIGFVKDRQGANGELQGYTMGKPANVVTESDEDMLATVPHEIAHGYNVGDEYSGGTLNPAVNNPPYGMTGKDWNNPEKDIVGNKEFVIGDSENYGDGSIIPADLRPFEYGGRGFLPNMVSYMGSGGKQEYYWTTPVIWDHLFRVFTGQITDTSEASSITGSVTSAGQAVDGRRITGKTDTKVKSKMIEVSGWVYKDGKVDVEPWYSEEYFDETWKEEEGAYSVAALDKDGKVLVKQGFDISFNTMSSQAINIKKAPFSVFMPFPADTKSFEIRKDNTVLKKVPVSANAPVVTITAPKENVELKGRQTIKWDASDADGDNMEFEVWFSPDGEEWDVVGTNLKKNSLEVNFDQLPGSDEAYLYIYATDGVNTTEIASVPFKVAFKGPEIIVEEPEDPNKVNKYTEDEEIWIEAGAFDMQDGWLAEESLIWNDFDGEEIGYGEVIYCEPGDLPVGSYQITLTATNSKGLSTKQVFELEVVEDKEKPNVKVNGKLLSLDVPPTIVEGRMLVPLRAIFEALGGSVAWDGATRTVTGTKGDTTVILQLDNNNAKVNGKDVTLDVAAIAVNGRTLVPLRFVSESLGAQVAWDGANKTAVITTDGTQAAAAEVFAVTSAFQQGKDIPAKYAYKDVAGGKNTSLPLAWSGIPAGTKSLAVLMYDLHPVAQNWVHWAVINIPAGSNGIAEGASGTARMPQGSAELTNSYGESGYGGPCPPSDTGKHEYKFIVYALNADKIDLSGAVTAEQFQAAVEAKMLGKTELSGYFKQ